MYLGAFPTYFASIMAVEVFGFSLSLTWLLASSTVGVFFTYDYWCHTYWWRHGVAHIPPLPILANMLEMTNGLAAMVLKASKKYGRVYGIYDTRTPILVCGDPEMLKHIMVKSFKHFNNRKEIPLNNKEIDLNLANLKDEHWRGVRNVLIPTFSATKMKLMSNIVNKSADKLVEHISKTQEADGCIECKDVFGAFVMDTIGSCLFGLNVDSQANPNDPFVYHANRAFNFSLFNIWAILVGLFPWLNPIVCYFNIGLLPEDSIDFFRDVTRKAVAIRRESADGTKSKRVDFLQMIIDSQVSNGEAAPEGEPEKERELDVHDELFKQAGSVAQTRSGSKAKLTDAELLAQAMMFFVAGYDTTSTFLCFTSYLLAMNPDAQEKLIREVDEMLPSSDQVGYGTVSKLPYLDKVFCESLRFYPPGCISDRVCTETFTYDNITVPQGMQVIIPIYAIHHDPDLWPQPEKFDPERFTKEEREKRHPFAWLPFGGGPRMCLGMRFALMESKVAMVRVLQRYRLETCPQTEIPPTLGKLGIITPPNGIILRAIPREDAK